MKIGSTEIDLQELGAFVLTLWAGFSWWRIKFLKAKALIAKNRPEDIQTDIFPTPTLNPGGIDDQACRGPADQA
jgi:hypothetical protein